MEGEIMDFINNITDMIRDAVKNAKDTVDLIKDIKTEVKNDKTKKNESETERILFYLLEDKEVIEAIESNMNEMRLRVLLREKLDKKDLKYLSNVTQYLMKIQDKINF